MKTIILSLIITLNTNGHINEMGYNNLVNTLAYDISDKEMLEELDQEYREQINISNVDTIGAMKLYSNLISSGLDYIKPYNNYEGLRKQILNY